MDRTVMELRGMLKERGLSTQGSREELEARLNPPKQEDQNHDSQEAEQAERRDTQMKAEAPPAEEVIDIRDAITTAQSFISSLLDKPVDGVTGVKPVEDGAVVTIDLVDLERIPHSTDVLVSYELHINRKSEVDSYQRTNRFTRAERK